MFADKYDCGNLKACLPNLFVNMKYNLHVLSEWLFVSLVNNLEFLLAEPFSCKFNALEYSLEIKNCCCLEIGLSIIAFLLFLFHSYILWKPALICEGKNIFDRKECVICPHGNKSHSFASS